MNSAIYIYRHGILASCHAGSVMGGKCDIPTHHY